MLIDLQPVYNTVFLVFTTLECSTQQKEKKIKVKKQNDFFKKIILF